MRASISLLAWVMMALILVVSAQEDSEDDFDCDYDESEPQVTDPVMKEPKQEVTNQVYKASPQEVPNRVVKPVNKPAPSKKTLKRYAGYYPSYNSELQSLDQLNYNLYTDLVYFVAVPELNMTFSYGDVSPSKAEANAMDFAKRCFLHNVKPIISVGGWTGSQHFSNLTRTDQLRASFAKSLVMYAQRLGFLGLDLDWEYPNSEAIGCNAVDPMDTVNFGKLLKEIRRQWPTAQLSAALGIGGLVGARGPATTAEVSDIAANLDFVNLMAYDMAGPWSSTTAPASAISSACSPTPGDSSIETGLQTMLAQGFKDEQITLGIPAYARSFELQSPKLLKRTVRGIDTYYYQNKTSRALPGGSTDDQPGLDICGNQGTYGGIWLVKELQEKKYISEDLLHGLNGFKRYFDKCSGTPFLTNGTTFLSYDDQVSTVSKAKLAREKKLAGLFIFDTTGFNDSVNVITRAALDH